MCANVIRITIFGELITVSNSKRVTLMDVAREADVSVGTVSRVLNHREGHIKISEATQNQVIEAARKLGYQPNIFATALRTQRSGVIGAIVRDIGDPFLSLLAKEIQKKVREHGLNLLLANAEYDLDQAGKHIAYMHSHFFDGLLLIGDIPGDFAIINELRKSGTPYVTVARGQSADAPIVNIDEKKGVYMGISYLRDLGHKDIAFISDLRHGGVKEREEYFQNYYKKNSLFLNKDYVKTCHSERKEAVACAQRLLSLQQPPTAIFCATDLAAIGTMFSVLRMGLRIPEDVSVLGFDDIEISSDFYPALSTVRQPVGVMAEKAVNLLMELINGINKDDVIEDRILVKPQLIIRQSCSACER